jgi:hypothetical protein
MADEKHSVKRSKAKKAGSRKSARKAGAKESAAKQAPRSAVVFKKIATRKPVPIKKARVGKRAVLLPPPPTVSLKATRSPVRRASRAKALLRNKGAVKTNPATCEIAVCTEAALREKLRLAAPYVELWLSRHKGEPSDAPTPEAAFVRIWQWLTLEAKLDDHRVVTGELVQAFFAEEAQRLRP